MSSCLQWYVVVHVWRRPCFATPLASYPVVASCAGQKRISVRVNSYNDIVCIMLSASFAVNTISSVHANEARHTSNLFLNHFHWEERNCDTDVKFILLLLAYISPIRLNPMDECLLERGGAPKFKQKYCIKKDKENINKLLQGKPKRNPFFFLFAIFFIVNFDLCVMHATLLLNSLLKKRYK
jgi:hypothetical protein